MEIIGPIAFVVLCAFLVWLIDPNGRALRRFERELAAREPVSDAELVARYFLLDSVAPEVPGQVRQEFAKHMGYAPDKLLPDDDLNAFWNDVDMIELVKDLEERFDIQITDADAERTHCTIRSVSQLISEKIGLTKRHS